ncbi:hypothetical protein BO82DRAFT_362425 [Aspergillus uvarum CBS 121591]|uniref:Uncharacterized protein n=1 Tax=Aspergillus uvarum CBS 121591 TaxID=1448315 RepID=A0A319CJP3_9EURO|nr:hypothetical protein BO82DRAFT_362425 [Aspergillus uvarum CBS 121591]PYH84690.1 hypothetical protein BO82DRAFT_362425 [Aspergillus uvarum CBS 121591]
MSVFKATLNQSGYRRILNSLSGDFRALSDFCSRFGVYANTCSRFGVYAMIAQDSRKYTSTCNRTLQSPRSQAAWKEDDKHPDEILLPCLRRITRAVLASKPPLQYQWYNFCQHKETNEKASLIQSGHDRKEEGKVEVVVTSVSVLNDILQSNSESKCDIQAKNEDLQLARNSPQEGNFYFVDMRGKGLRACGSPGQLHNLRSAQKQRHRVCGCVKILLGSGMSVSCRYSTLSHDWSTLIRYTLSTLRSARHTFSRTAGRRPAFKQIALTMLLMRPIDVTQNIGMVDKPGTSSAFSRLSNPRLPNNPNSPRRTGMLLRTRVSGSHHELVLETPPGSLIKGSAFILADRLSDQLTKMAAREIQEATSIDTVHVEHPY